MKQPGHATGRNPSVIGRPGAGAPDPELIDALPGDPVRAWAEEAAQDPGRPERPWIPSAADLPPWRTAADLEANYTPLPRWWERWMLAFIAVGAGCIVIPLGALAATFEDGARRLLGIAVVAIMVAIIIGCILVFAIREVRFRRQRHRHITACLALLEKTAVPVWAVFQDRVRVSGGGDTISDLQFVFDLRVPTETLLLQRRVVETWLDQIAATFDTDAPERFPERFARSGPVHCRDIFGEGMHGVWIWDKPSILPFQVLGLAVVDPRETPSLEERHVIFLRDQPRELRRRSSILRRA